VPSAAVFARGGAPPAVLTKDSPVRGAVWTDAAASWIGAAPSGTAPASWVYFYTVLDVERAQTVTVQYAAEDACSVTVNGVLINTKAARLWAWIPAQKRFTTFETTLQAGRNVVVIGAVNYGDGQGVIASITSGEYAAADGTVLVDTSLAQQEAWTWSTSALTYLCSAAEAPPTPPMSAVVACGEGDAFLVEDYGKGTCLHVAGAATPSGWAFPAEGKHNVITQPCAGPANAGAVPNQEWAWNAPYLTHAASGLNLAVAAALVQDGSYVTLALPGVRAPDGVAAASAPDAQAWTWENYGLLVPQASPSFALTDARASARDIPGLPVHLWELHASLPSGIPNANWAQLCVPRS
jgi:hypothetical protein